MNYYVWSASDKDCYVIIRELPAELYENSWKLREGVPCGEWFPSHVEFKVSEQGGVVLPDAIKNYHRMLIVSDKLKVILEEKSGALFEFFQITILDKKGRSVNQKYYIANLLDSVDCMDMERSEYEMDSLIKDQVMGFDLLVLNPEKLSSDDHIFRLKTKTDLIIIDDPLSDAILDAGCKGIFFQDVDDYGSEFRE